MEYTFGLIGAGNMGGAIAHAVSQTTKAGILADHNPRRAQSLAEELGFAHGTNEVVAQNSQYLFLGVKPHLMGAMLADIQSVLAARQDAFVLVTMARVWPLNRSSAWPGALIPSFASCPTPQWLWGRGWFCITPVNRSARSRWTSSFSSWRRQAASILWKNP